MEMVNQFPPKGERDRKIRTAIKTASWRITAAILTFASAWILTKNLSISFGIFLVREAVAIILYYIHERTWNKIKWGRYRIEKINVPPREK